MIKYMVHVLYHKFIFDEASEAVAFANNAMMHTIDSNDRKSISIDLIEEQEENTNDVEF